MRPSKKTAVLEAMVGIVDDTGVADVTYDNLARRCGMSKSGLVYHFPTRRDMLRDLHRHMARQWEAKLVAAAGGPAAEVTPRARLRAALEVAAQEATRAELVMSIESAVDDEFRAIWADMLAPWLPPTAEITSDGDAMDAMLVQLIADGLWANFFLNGTRLTPAQRDAIVEAASRLIPG